MCVYVKEGRAWRFSLRFCLTIVTIVMFHVTIGIHNA